MRLLHPAASKYHKGFFLLMFRDKWDSFGATHYRKITYKTNSVFARSGSLRFDFQIYTKIRIALPVELDFFMNQCIVSIAKRYILVIYER